MTHPTHLPTDLPTDRPPARATLPETLAAQGLPAPQSPVVEDPWAALRRHTRARIALGRTGVSLPTRAHLEFTAAHALARDAVHHPLDVAGVRDAITGLGHECLTLASAAGDRPQYLRRPDLGRRLAPPSRELLEARRTGTGEVDLVVVVADGLSALAVERQAAALLEQFGRLLERDPAGWALGPVCLVTQGRVAVGDEIGAALRARLVVVLIGERPGLSSPDSLGVYLTWAPRVGLTDARRNCISNVRPEGLPVAQAAARLHWLASSARRLELSGVDLKDESGLTQLE